MPVKHTKIKTKKSKEKFGSAEKSLLKVLQFCFNGRYLHDTFCFICLKIR